MTGQSLGPYQVIEPLGAGGMGEVYRARDTKLNREVAIKLVPEAFRADAQRMARFEREAKLLAALNHPNIAAIYGLEEAGEQSALALELVEGDTLGQRIARGPMEPRQAAELAFQIAEALESAHQAGIIHRDLKPANVKITRDGKIKVLDFGLAKALGDEPATNADATVSPTLSLAATRAGVILGTAGYMSPEQARGDPVDQRADIWAFGVILYEMLTGRRAFSADTVPDTLARVLTQDPDWNRLDTNLPQPLKKLVRRCLNKDAKRRLRDIGDVRLELEELLEESKHAAESAGAAATAIRTGAPAVAGEGAMTSSAGDAAALTAGAAGAAVTVGAGGMTGPLVDARPARKISLQLAAGIAILAGALGAAAMWWSGAASTPEAGFVTTFSIPYAEETRLTGGTHPVAISPDGRYIVHVVISMAGAGRWLEARRLDQLRGRRIFGTDGAGYPFVSHDGRYVVFFRGGTLLKVSLEGGEPPATLCTVPGNGFQGGAGLVDGSIVFASAGRLYRVSGTGGTPEPIPVAEDVSLSWPAALPGDDAVLATVISAGKPSIVVVALGDGSMRELVRDGTAPRYAGSGHLAFVRGGLLFVVPFDPSTLTTLGEPVPTQERVYEQLGSDWAGHYDVSAAGSLAFVPPRGIRPFLNGDWCGQSSMAPIRHRASGPGRTRRHASIPSAAVSR